VKVKTINRKKRESDRLRKRLFNFNIIILTFAFVLFTFSDCALCADINITPSLPADCSECGAVPTIPIPIVVEKTDATYITCDPGDWGDTSASDDPNDHLYTLTSACFNSPAEEWNAFLATMTTTVGIIKKCPSHPPNVACLGDVAGKTKAQAQALLAIYPADPITISDVEDQIGRAHV
jgi:hypothetical protein